MSGARELLVGVEKPVGRAGSVTSLATTPIKGLRLLSRREVMLTGTGVLDNRCFFLIDAGARMINGKRSGLLTTITAGYGPEDERLELTFPDGSVVAGEALDGGEIEVRFLLTMSVRLVHGPFAEALSDFVDEPLRLVRADPLLTASDRGPGGSVSLISQASVRHLSELAREPVDPRRFRMLIEVDGLPAHGEDALVGEQVRIGEALVAFRGHVGRCLVTTRHPETGEVDLPTLELLAYRRGLDTTEPLAFGIYGEVIEPGRVRLGDPFGVGRAR